MIPPVQHDVLRLQIAVDDPVLVEVMQRQQHLSKHTNHKFAKLLPLISVLDSDPIGSGFNKVPKSVSGSGSREQKLSKKIINFIFEELDVLFLRAEGFSLSLDIRNGGLGISKLQFSLKKERKNVQLFFLLTLVIKTLGTD
jgi:hypothetical protein